MFSGNMTNESGLTVVSWLIIVVFAAVLIYTMILQAEFNKLSGGIQYGEAVKKIKNNNK
jgi:hypothetical protein